MCGPFPGSLPPGAVIPHRRILGFSVTRPRQGLDLVREEQRTHARLWMLARKAERLDLSPWLGAGLREGTPVPPGRA